MKREENSKTNLNDLIQRIKQEGVEEARKKSSDIFREAEKTASVIVGRAKKEAMIIVDDAEKEIKKKQEASKKVIEHALRDALLSFRKAVVEIFDSIIKEECHAVLNKDLLEKILLNVIEAWQKDKDKNLDILLTLNETDRNALFEGFLMKLKEKIRGKIELKLSPDIEAGFYIGFRDESFYYDFTDEVIAQILSVYLDPKLCGIIDSVIKKKR